MNLDFIKKKLNTLKGKDKKDTKFWKPEDGEQTIRILPYKFNLENPFVELKLYYFRQPDGKTKTLLSPSVNGNPDPVLKFCDKLRSTGTRENWILSKNYEPKLRTYVPIIVRGKEKEGVKYWGFGKTVYESILEKMSHPDLGDITDLLEGNDLIVTFDKKPASGKKYPETNIEARFKKTPAVNPSETELLAKIQDQVDIMTLFTEPTYEDLNKEFQNFLNENEPTATSEPQAPTDDTSSDDTGNTGGPVSAVSESATAARVTTPEQTQVASPSAEKASANLSPEETKRKFKQMFADAAK